ncbi:YcnI family protein [Rhodococcus sp. NPDC058521]|uniref:YcnI family copper-binding membrane protein n=1 Tax=Rhodococcus sp. NPDC058521 TaxID=3346536 RepID=UPI003650F6B0
MNSLVSRALFTAGAAGCAMLLTAGVASAHVTVVAPDAEQGGYSVLTFRVPTESETASTTKVSVQLPGLKSARTEPLPGWTSVVDKDPESQLATSVTWTADPGVGVAPGQFQQFVLSAGPLPEEEEVSFAAAQTYSDGEVVNWDQKPADDGSEPEKPAPSLTLAAASEDGHGHGDHSAGSSGASESSEASDDSSTDDTARWLGGIGLVLGALGAALGIGATIRGRRS